MSFIILDRDGVINYDSDEYIKSPEEWLPIPGSLSAIAELNRHGFRVVIATNQSGIARGYFDRTILDKIHEKLLQAVADAGGTIEGIFFCPHHPEEGCTCRKPQPGLLLQIQTAYSIDLSEVYFIGDSLGDINAAKAAGCVPLLVLTGKGQKTLETYPEIRSVPNFKDLASAVNYVLAKQRKN